MLGGSSVADVICFTSGCNPSMESYQNLSLSPSLQQLLQELKNLIAFEASRTGKPWIRVTRLSELFGEKYGASLEEVAQARGCQDNLRSLFKIGRHFLIYSTPNPQEFYVALWESMFPDYDLKQERPIQYRIKRPWKVDGNLLSMLKAEGAEEIKPQHIQQIQQFSEYQPILVPLIESVNDLEIALIEIIKSLAINRPKQLVTVGVVSQKFREHYQQPIRVVMRTVCPDIKLIDLLKTIPALSVQEVDRDWQINVEVDVLEKTGG